MKELAKRIKLQSMNKKYALVTQNKVGTGLFTLAFANTRADAEDLQKRFRMLFRSTVKKSVTLKILEVRKKAYKTRSVLLLLK